MLKSWKLLPLMVALVAGPAQAVTFVSVAGAPDPGAPGFSPVVTFDAPNAAGYIWSGNIQTQIGSNASAAAPAGDATRFGFVSSALNPNSALLTTPALSAVSFYWGSIDGFNTVDVLGLGGSLLTIAGNQLPPANGDQGAAITNRRIFITAGPGEAIFGLRFTSTGVAFEFDDVAAVQAVPEPATWAMMIAGFGVIGASMRRRRAPMRVSFV